MESGQQLTFEEFEAGGEPEYAPVSDSSYGGPVSVPEVSGGRDTSDLDDEAASLYVPGEPDDSASEVYKSFCWFSADSAPVEALPRRLSGAGQLI